MLSWITNAVGNIASWLGEGVASLASWLLNGIGTVLTKVINALGGIWYVLEALWNAAVGFLGSINTLLTALFPFVPVVVIDVIMSALLVSVVAGVYRMVRK